MVVEGREGLLRCCGETEGVGMHSGWGFWAKAQKCHWSVRMQVGQMGLLREETQTFVCSLGSEPSG